MAFDLEICWKENKICANIFFSKTRRNWKMNE
jgi:hypothetical protein